MDVHGRGWAVRDSFDRDNRDTADLGGRLWIVGVTFAHNHPSGVAQPSQADELLTRNLKEALALVEIKVLDHFIVAGRQTLSFAERGLL